MSTVSIIVIAAIVVLSILAVVVAEEPLDEVFHVKAAMQGFPLQPLATKVVSKPSIENDTSNEGGERGEFKQLIPRSCN